MLHVVVDRVREKTQITIQNYAEVARVGKRIEGDVATTVPPVPKTGATGGRRQKSTGWLRASVRSWTQQGRRGGVERKRKVEPVDEAPPAGDEPFCHPLLRRP